MGKPFVLGVTGIIGAGKSTICRMLEDFGFTWIDADNIVRELYQPGKMGYQKIRGYFGEDFVHISGVNREKLRKFVLESPQKLWILNKLIHPLVAHEVNKKIVQLKKGKICLEAVYFEKEDLGKFIDALIIVDADPPLIEDRISDRKLSQRDLEKWFTIQKKNLPREFPVISNNADFDTLRAKVEQFLKKGIILKDD